MAIQKTVMEGCATVIHEPHHAYIMSGAMNRPYIIGFIRINARIY